MVSEQMVSDSCLGARKARALDVGTNEECATGDEMTITNAGEQDLRLNRPGILETLMWPGFAESARWNSWHRLLRQIEHLILDRVNIPLELCSRHAPGRLVPLDLGRTA